MINKNVKSLLNIVTVSAALTLVVAVATNYSALKKTDATYAQSCNDNNYLFANPDGYSFTQANLVAGETIYNGDNRFNFLSVPSYLQGINYIKTENKVLKDSIDNNTWAIYVCKPSKVYVLYRRITGKTPPPWITSAYTKESPDSVSESNINSFVVRKNIENIRGLYDIYSLNVQVPRVILFRGASTNSNQAYSMYVVGVKPNDGSGGNNTTPAPTTNNTPRPTTVATTRATTTPTTRPTTAPTIFQTQPPVSGATYPAQILNLTNWKITLPLSGAPEVKQPALNTYRIDPWFVVQGSGVRFRAPVNGGTTSGSSNPRSELREMTNNGSSNASWSSGSGTNTMTIDQMVTSLPGPQKPHLVVGQIHDGSDDVTVFRVEGSTLWITNGDSTHGYAVDTNFQLNRRFTVKFEVANNVTKYYYNGNLVPYTLNKSYSGAYFKAGAYTQANCSNNSPCSADNYGEVIIYNLQVTH